MHSLGGFDARTNALSHHSRDPTPRGYLYVPPGTKITDVNGTRWVCGPDGYWFRDYSRIRVTEITLLAPRALAG